MLTLYAGDFCNATESLLLLCVGLRAYVVDFSVPKNAFVTQKRKMEDEALSELLAQYDAANDIARFSLSWIRTLLKEMRKYKVNSNKFPSHKPLLTSDNLCIYLGISIWYCSSLGTTVVVGRELHRWYKSACACLISELILFLLIWHLVWNLREQICVAAIDTGDTALAIKSIDTLKKQFSNSNRVKRLEGMLLESEGLFIATYFCIYINIYILHNSNISDFRKLWSGFGSVWRYIEGWLGQCRSDEAKGGQSSPSIVWRIFTFYI